MKTLCFAIVLMLLCAISKGDDAQYKVTFAIVKKNVVITIENLTDAKLPMYMAPRRDRIPAWLKIKVKDKNNQIVSVNDSSPSGYWSPRIRESGFIMLPLKNKPLAPKSRRKIVVPLDPLLRGLWVKWEDKANDHLFLVNFIIHSDAYVQDMFLFESDWMKLK